MTSAQASVINNIGGGLIPPQDVHLKRFPFLILVDVSRSTGGGDQPDINSINRCLPELLEGIRNPLPGTELYDHKNQVDLALVAYSDTPELVFAFQPAASILPTIKPFTPRRTTATGSAFEFALSLIGHRLRFLDSQNIPVGMCHIIHITDGAPNDMPVGSLRWREIAAKLGNVSGIPAAGGEAKEVAKVLHYVTPNGCDPNNEYAIQDENGNKISGLDALARLTGHNTVFSMESGVGSFTDFVELVTVVISRVTELFPAYEVAHQQAQYTNGNIKPIQ